MKITLYGHRYHCEDGAPIRNRFTICTTAEKLVKLSGVRLPMSQTVTEGMSLEEYAITNEVENERFFRELDEYFTRVYEVPDDEILRVEYYFID